MKAEKEFRITKQLFDASAKGDEPLIAGSAKSDSATMLKLTVERHPSKLQFAKNMIHIIGLMKQVTLIVLLICLCTGIDLAHLVVYRELRLTVLNGLT